jgi:PIN domain nuclease of toxin-antitoxin system
MRLLIDTHVFLWWLDGDSKLPVAMRKQIGETANEILVSAASAWELTTKARIGKLPRALAVADDVEQAISSQGFLELPVTVAHAAHAGNLPGPLRDPFDRLLIAQARIEGTPIVSADRAMDDYGVDRLWKRT